MERLESQCYIQSHDDSGAPRFLPAEVQTNQTEVRLFQTAVQLFHI